MKKTALSCLLIFIFLLLVFSGCSGKSEQVSAVSVSEDSELLDTGVILLGITAVGFSNNDSYFASGTGEGSLMIWDLSRGRRIHALRIADNAITSVAFSPDEQYVAAGTSAGEIVVWEFRGDAGKNAYAHEVFKVRTSGVIGSIVYSETEIVSFAMTGELCRWDRNTGRLRSRQAAEPDGVVYDSAALGQGGKNILYTRGAQLNLLDFNSGEQRHIPADERPLISAAISAEGNTFAAAGDTFVQVWNTVDDSRPKQIELTEKNPALAVNRYADRLLAGSESGTVRMLSLETGEEIAAFRSFGTSDETGEWICMLPSGHYNASAGGAALMKVNADGEYFSMSQFSNALFRPDIVSAAIAKNGKIVLEHNLKDILNNDLAPLVEIRGSKSISVSGNSADVPLKITVRSGGLGRLKLTIHLDKDDRIIGYRLIQGKISNNEEQRSGIRIQRQYKERSRDIYEVVCSIPLQMPGRNSIGISVFGSRRSMESDAARIDINTDWPGPEPDSTLHVLTMSIQNYQSPGISRLNSPHKDADDLAALFQLQEGGRLYKKVRPYPYKDELVSKDNFLNIFEEIAKEVGRNDDFVFFFAGHGDVWDGDFFFVPYDSIGMDRNPPERNITMDDIVDGITQIQSRNSLVLLDTCNSGTILNANDTAFNRLIEKLNQKAIITASLGDQEALEDEENGFFTRAILASYFDNPEEQYSMVKNMIDFTVDHVEQQSAARLESEEYEDDLYLDETDMNNQYIAIASALLTSRGAIKEGFTQPQHPSYSKPGEQFIDFRVFDRFTEPGILEIQSLYTPGVLSVFDMSRQEELIKTVSIGAGKTTSLKDLQPGPYKLVMAYDNGIDDEAEVKISNKLEKNKFVAATTYYKFDYRPGLLNITTVSAGTLRINGMSNMGGAVRPGSTITRDIPPGTYSVSMEYDDRYVETYTITHEGNGDTQLRFIYRSPAPGFVYVPPGTFSIGSPVSEADRRDNESRHTVSIRNGFYIAPRAVTQAEYRDVMGANPSANKGDKLPVEMVAWLDAVRYCNERSAKEGLRPAYSIRAGRAALNDGSNGYRLPTEAEWEYACRAGTTSPYYTGTNITTAQANFRNNPGRTLETGMFRPNNWGLYDMTGNVWEWCWDWYAPYSGEAQTDPSGPASGEFRVVRGGGYNTSFTDNLRSAYRGYDEPGLSKDSLGFRVVRSR